MSDRMNDLRDEAKRLGEDFSPALHARVMAKVRAEAAPSHVRESRPWRYVLAAAAMIAIAAGAWVMTRPAIEPPTPKKELAKDFSISNPMPQVASVQFSGDAGNPAYAYLDHDAKAFGRFMAKQLDVLPALP